MKKFWKSKGLVLLLILSGCATAPPRELSEARTISGSWRGYRKETVGLTTEDGETLLLRILYPRTEPPYRLVLLYHGVTASYRIWEGDGFTHGEVLSEKLLEQGCALAYFDEPHHGSRNNGEDKFFSIFLPFRWTRFAREVSAETAFYIDYLQTLPDISSAPPFAVGYSMGAAVLYSVAQSVELAGMVTAVPPPLGRMLSGESPLSLASKTTLPLLLLPAERDDSGMAVSEYKPMINRMASEDFAVIWYDSTHSLPEEWTDRAAEWIAEH